MCIIQKWIFIDWLIEYTYSEILIFREASLACHCTFVFPCLLLSCCTFLLWLISTHCTLQGTPVWPNLRSPLNKLHANQYHILFYVLLDIDVSVHHSNTYFALHSCRNPVLIKIKRKIIMCGCKRQCVVEMEFLLKTQIKIDFFCQQR